MTKTSADLPDEIKDTKKRKLISNLLKGEPEEDARYVFVIEHLKATKLYGFIKFEVFSAKKTLFRLKIQQHIPNQDNIAPTLDMKQQNQFNWDSLKVGKRKLRVGLIDVESKTLFEKIREGVEVGLEEGRIPFFPRM